MNGKPGGSSLVTQATVVGPAGIIAATDLPLSVLRARDGLGAKVILDMGHERRVVITLSGAERIALIEALGGTA